MRKKLDFYIEDGVLQAYEGRGGVVVVPDGVTMIGNEAFAECKKLTEIIIPESVRAIGEEAFFLCTGLKSVTIKSPEIGIGFMAFCGCKHLKNLSLPDNVTEIGESAFAGCNALADEKGFIIVNGILFDYIGKEKNVVVPDGVRVIGRSVFYNAPNPFTGKKQKTDVESVSLPESVIKICPYAFYKCAELKNINIPGGLQKVWKCSFEGCDRLPDLHFPEDILEEDPNSERFALDGDEYCDQDNSDCHNYTEE